MAAIIENPEAARRLARAIASDVSMYNEKKVIKGIEDDNLFDALKDEIEEGRNLFKSRVTPEIFEKSNLYELALVDLLVRPKAHVKTKIW